MTWVLLARENKSSLSSPRADKEQDIQPSVTCDDKGKNNVDLIDNPKL